jgi:hypothetical protein
MINQIRREPDVSGLISVDPDTGNSAAIGSTSSASHAIDPGNSLACPKACPATVMLASAVVPEDRTIKDAPPAKPVPAQLAGTTLSAHGSQSLQRSPYAAFAIPRST